LKLRIVSYAINGRGVGHLMRQLAILRWIRRLTAVMNISAELWVLTSSEADTLARREGVPALKMPSKAMVKDAGTSPIRYLKIAKNWVLQSITALDPDILLVDTFPSGSFGELLGVLELVETKILIARRVRPEFSQESHYKNILSLYTHIICPDDSDVGPIMIRERAELLTRQDARQTLGAVDDRKLLYLSVGGGGDVQANQLLPKMITQIHKEFPNEYHIVVGAGPLYQGREIRGANITWLSRYVGMELMRGFDIAISAGGYNSYHELMHAGVPTIFLPLPRIADDQHERVQRAHKAQAGRAAKSWQEAISLLKTPSLSVAACSKLVPNNGARNAAISILSTRIPKEKVEQAAAIYTPENISIMRKFGDHAESLELLRLFALSPSEERIREQVQNELKQECDINIPKRVPHLDRVQRLLTLYSALDIELDTFIYLCQSIIKKFPYASLSQRLSAVEILFPLWNQFDDWMGASALLRNIPTQRSLSIIPFSHMMRTWLESQDDLFDALREFSHLENRGRKTVAEVLHHLIHGENHA